MNSSTREKVIELQLSQPVNVTTTTRIRESLRERIETEQLDGTPIELINFNVLVCCTNGVGRHMVDFVDYELQRGTAIWIRPGQVQKWSDTRADFEAEVTVFSSSSIPDLPFFQHLDGTTLVTELGDDTSRVLDLIRWMRSDLDEHQDFSAAASVVSVILRVLTRNARVHPLSSTARGDLVQSFIESIERNVEQRSVTWHAQNIGASTRSVARAAVEVLDLRPKQVIDDHVILEARRRLAWSKDDIATISRSLQFSEPSNFTKYFRTHTGQSPLSFRRDVAALGPPRSISASA